MTSNSLLLHKLPDTDEEHGELYDEVQSPESVSRRRHGRHSSIFDGLISPVWARQRRSLCNAKIASISCAVGLILLLGLALFNYYPLDEPQQPSDIKYFFVFGDSYSRTGFNANGAMPSEASPFGNPLHNATTSGGYNWAHVLTTQYNRSLTYMYNVAAGGATVETYLIPAPHDMSVRDFGDQMSTFNKAVHRKGGPTLQQRKDGLYAVWFGQNDVDQTYNRTYSDPNATFDYDFDIYFDHVSDLWHSGAREFLFIGVGPISKSPMVLAEQNATEVEELSQSFNEKLTTRIRKFASEYEGVTWYYYDPASAFDRVWAEPERFGVADNNCMARNGVSCIWHDHFHPGIRVHEQVAADIANLGCSIFATQDVRNSTNIENPK